MDIVSKLPDEMIIHIFEFLPGSVQGLLKFDAYYKYPSYVEPFTNDGYSNEYIHYCIENDLWMPFNRILYQMRSQLSSQMVQLPNGLKRTKLSILKINMLSTCRNKKCFNILNLHILLSSISDVEGFERNRNILNYSIQKVIYKYGKRPLNTNH